MCSVFTGKIWEQICSQTIQEPMLSFPKIKNTIGSGVGDFLTDNKKYFILYIIKH